MEQIKNPAEYEVCLFDGLMSSAVYTGSFDNLNRVSYKLSWHEKSDDDYWYKPLFYLTLDEIKDQLKNLYGGTAPRITIFIERPMSGVVLQYGNYGDSWWEIGKLNGYA